MTRFSSLQRALAVALVAVCAEACAHGAAEGRAPASAAIVEDVRRTLASRCPESQCRVEACWSADSLAPSAATCRVEYSSMSGERFRLVSEQVREDLEARRRFITLEGSETLGSRLADAALYGLGLAVAATLLAAP